MAKCKNIFLRRYAQYGEVSPKVDVYAFGVVLFELISGKPAIVKTNETENESKGLVALVVNISDPSYNSSLVVNSHDLITNSSLLKFSLLDEMQFEEVIVLPDPKEDLGKLVDPRLGENYPIDSVFKVHPY